MIKTDFHIHSSFSHDSKDDPVTMIESAIEKGFSIICFTDHVDLDFPKQIITFDTAEYTTYITKLREEYKKHIEVRMGVEVGVQPHVSLENNVFVESAPFDFVIASTHVIRGLRPKLQQFSEYKERYDLKEGMRVFLEETLINIKKFHNFDVYGHLDYLSTCTYEGTPFSYQDNRELTDEILKLLIEKGKGLELNTRLVKKYEMGSPCKEVLIRYRELGGEIITLGSDTHTHQNLGNNIEWGMEHLKECGFRYFTVYKERKPEYIKLE